MDPHVLIHALVKQTAVFIAQLATVEGSRVPLANLSNDLFVGLVRELERQGVSKKVIADMFGMALRSYRQKVQRLGESETTRGVTLWTAVQNFVTERGTATRNELLERFRFDEESTVRSILNDLTESGLLMRSGRGEDTRYRMATPEELEDLGATQGPRAEDSRLALVWLQIYRKGPLLREELLDLVSIGPTALDETLEKLIADSRIRCRLVDDQEVYQTEHVLLPLGEPAGWQAALLDHHHAMLQAFARKLLGGHRIAVGHDEIGGTTLTFDLWPGHPREQEVRRLLAETRGRILPLWEEVTAYNTENPGRPADTYQVHFYCGQSVGVDRDEDLNWKFDPTQSP
jgi:hypothetical protein